jgi:hypothetical protein
MLTTSEILRWIPTTDHNLRRLGPAAAPCLCRRPAFIERNRAGCILEEAAAAAQPFEPPDTSADSDQPPQRSRAPSHQRLQPAVP